MLSLLFDKTFVILFCVYVYFTSGGSRGGSLGSDEPPSGWVWWLKTLVLHGCIKVVQ